MDRPFKNSKVQEMKGIFSHFPYDHIALSKIFEELGYRGSFKAKVLRDVLEKHLAQCAKDDVDVETKDSAVDTEEQTYANLTLQAAWAGHRKAPCWQPRDK